MTPLAAYSRFFSFEFLACRRRAKRAEQRREQRLDLRALRPADA